MCIFGDSRLSQSDCLNQKLQQSFIPGCNTGELPDKAFMVTCLEFRFFGQKGCCQFTGEDAGPDQKSKFRLKGHSDKFQYFKVYESMTMPYLSYSYFQAILKELERLGFQSISKPFGLLSDSFGHYDTPRIIMLSPLNDSRMLKVPCSISYFQP